MRQQTLVDLAFSVEMDSADSAGDDLRVLGSADDGSAREQRGALVEDELLRAKRREHDEVAPDDLGRRESRPVGVDSLERHDRVVRSAIGSEHASEERCLVLVEGGRRGSQRGVSKEELNQAVAGRLHVPLRQLQMVGFTLQVSSLNPQ